jgi:hypothetical protein
MFVLPLRGDKAKNFPREYLYGGETVPEEVALRGMVDFEKLPFCGDSQKHPITKCNQPKNFSL